MQNKIRLAQEQKVPYMVVLGDREIEARTASPRTRAGEQQEPQAWEAFADRLAAEAARASRRLNATRPDRPAFVVGLRTCVLSSRSADGRASCARCRSTAPGTYEGDEPSAETCASTR